jgi:hypothetical protein
LTAQSDCITDMPQGQKVSSEIQWAVVRLSNFLNTEQIAMCLALSTRSVNRVNAHFRLHGSIKDDKPNELHGTHRHLRDVDVEVCEPMSIILFESEIVYLVSTWYYPAITRPIS